MNRALRDARAALSYYTILPSGAAARREAGAGTLAWLPSIGALVGTIAGLAAWAAWQWLHVSWSFAIAWALLIMLTGAIHVDGFLDSCDGLFASVAPARRMEILKDPRHGTFALVGMALAAVLWLGALATIPPPRYPIVLAFSGAAARFCAIAQTAFFPYARSATVTQRLVDPLDATAIFSNALLVEALAWCVGPWALTIAPVLVVSAWFAARWSSRRLGGGLTGDVYGALIVAADIATVCVLSCAATMPGR